MSQAITARIERFKSIGKKLKEERKRSDATFKAYILEIYKHINEIGIFVFDSPWRGPIYKIRILPDMLVKYGPLGDVVDKVDIKDESDLLGYLEEMSWSSLSIPRLEMTMQSVGSWIDRYVSIASVKKRAKELMK